MIKQLGAKAGFIAVNIRWLPAKPKPTFLLCDFYNSPVTLGPDRCV
jgi:hypothetical protein